MDRQLVDRCFNENEILHVTFIKKDGSVREMRCTTSALHIPEESRKEKESTSIVNEERPMPLNKKVYDLDKMAWRSFIYDNVTAISIK